MKKTQLSLSICLTMILFLGSNLLYAQQSKEDVVAATLDDVQAPLTVEALSEMASDVVASIDIEGNKSIGVATILTKIKTRVGQAYRQAVISDDLKRLYNTGYFSDVRVDRKEVPGGIKVVIFVEEKPIVEEITFSKIRYFNKRVLLSKIKTRTDKFLDRKDLNDDVNTIEEMYAKKGLTQATVDAEIFVDDATNKASIHLIVREGQRVKIRKISVLGNAAYKDKQIIRAMKSRPAWLFNKGALKEEVLDEDMNRVQAFYEKNGYIDAIVTYQTEKLRSGLVNVDVTIDEGKRYYIGNLEVAGNAILSSAEIITVMKDTRQGKIFSRNKLSQDVNEIKSLYFDRGYIFARVKEATSLNPQTGEVDVSLDVEEGGIAYINKIKIQGNVQTRDLVIRREIRMYPGDQFDGTKLRRSKERLSNLGYFEEVAFNIQDTSNPDQKDLVVNVKEAKTGSFSFGGGYSTVDKMIGFIEVEQRNFDFANWPNFTGGGQRLKLRAEAGSSRSDLMLSFTEPWMFDYPVSFGFDLYHTSHDRESDTGYAYDQTRTGAKIRLGKEISEYVSVGAYYRLDETTIENFDTNVSAALKAEEGMNVVSAVGFSVTKDKRDSVISPRKGWVTTAKTDFAGGPLAGDKDFYRFETSGAYYVPLRFDSVVEFNGRIGMVDEYGDSSQVPIFERYFAGGGRSIRGYDERAIGPYDLKSKDPIGGEGIFVGSIEYTIPLVDVIKFATFIDFGNVWAQYDKMFTNKLYTGVGFGLRIKTPIGPMNLDYGIPLDKEPGEDDESKSGKFYFSVSRGF